MTKNVKNVICIMLLLITCGLVYFTMTKVSSSNESGGMPNSNMNEKDNNMNEPPSKPDGESDSGNMSEPPSKPDNESDGNMSEPPSMPNGENKDMSMPNNTSKSIDTKYYIAFGIEGLVIGFIVILLIMTKFNSISFSEIFTSSDKTIIFILSTIILTALFTFGFIFITNKCFLNSNSNGGFNNNENNNVSYSGVKKITSDEDISSGEYSSSNADENAILISGGKSTISDVSVNKTGDSSEGDNSSFYGINSGIVAKDGANVTIKNAIINTDANGANGVFSYGGNATINNSNSDNTIININDSKITTNKDNSGGIMTTGGGIMNATNLKITTNGTSSAAIRSDRGGGTVNVDSGTYTTNGKGSPSIYSTADITVKNAKLISNVSEGIVIEGKNSVSIDNVELTDNNTTLNGQSTTYKNIFIYQSMSGDAAVGNASFTASNSTITTNKGDTLYITNTTATINLTNNKIISNDKSGNFLRIQKDSWGSSGSNGGNVTLNLDNQEAIGNIVVDSISTLTLSLKNGSYIEGTINSDNTAKNIVLNIDKDSKIKLTGDMYVSELNNDDTTNSNIDLNGYKLYVNNTQIK